MRPGKRLWLFNALVASVLAYAVEPPARHIQILSYLAPKAIETLANILDRKQVLRSKNWHEYAILFLAWTLIAVCQLADYRKQ